MAATLDDVVAAINAMGTASAARSAAESSEQIQRRLELLERENEKLERQKNLIDQRNDSKEKTAALRENEIKSLRNVESALETAIAAEKRKAVVDNELINNMKASITEIEKEIEALEQDTKNTDKNTAAKEKNKAAQDALANSISASVAVYGKHNTVNIANIKSTLESVKAAGLQGSAMAAAQGIAMGFVDTMISLAFAVDEASSAMMKQTGFSREQSMALMGNVQEMARYGVTAQDMQKAVGALQPVYTDFTSLATDQQNAVKDTASLLEKTGVSLADFGKGMQVSTKAFGQSATQATATARDLTDFSQLIGVSAQQMGADFAAAAPQLAKLGSDGTRAFKELARTSKITGLEISKLLRITDKFDTFEGAAEQAGMLNAALGGNFVNAMDLMMTTDPVERFEMIRDSILNTGLSFDDMSYYQRKFFAQAAGLEDVNDLALLMSGNMDSLAGANQKSSAEIERLQKRTEDFMTIGEKFKTLLQSLIPVITPLIDGLQATADWMRENTGTAKVLLGILGGFMLMATLAKLTTLFGGALQILGVGFASAGSAAGGAAAPLAASATQLFAIGAAVGIAAAGIGLMAWAFSKLNGEQLLGVGAALTAIAVAAVAAGIGGASAAPGILALGGAMLKLGIGLAVVTGSIALAAVGVKLMAEGFSSLFNAMSLEKLNALGGLLGTLAFPGNAIGIALSATAIGGLATTVGTLSAALHLVPLAKLKALGEFVAPPAGAPTAASMSGAALAPATAAAGARGAGAAGPVTVTAAAPNVSVNVTLDSEPIAHKAVVKVDDIVRNQARAHAT